MNANENHDANDRMPADGMDDEAKLTAYALGELSERERAAIEARLAHDPEARETVEQIRAMARELETGFAAQPSATLAPSQREKVIAGRPARGVTRRFGAPIVIAATLTLTAAGLYVASDFSENAPYVYSLFGDDASSRRVGFVDSASAPASTPAPPVVEYSRGLQQQRYGDPKAATTEVDANRRQKLEQLGYTGGSPANPSAAREVPSVPGQLGRLRSELAERKDQRRDAPGDRSLEDSLAGLAVEREKVEAVEELEEIAAPEPVMNTESYASIEENPFRRVSDEALSTFSIDVDTASYSNVRRMLNEGRLPPPSAVRIEEFINYFRYDYPQPDAGQPFSITTEVARCPWKPEHRLVLVGLQGRSVSAEDRKPANLVFLIDVSGSMNSADKLPLLVQSMQLLTEHLDHRDRVAIVVYAGASGLVLPSTSGFEQSAIRAALAQLSAGGSTNGGAGIELAYKVAQENYLVEGNNRVILATDGDFNVGITDRGSLVSLIEEKRKSGVFLSVLGFGSGNVKDDTMELLADKGNGNYAYIDSLKEAQKVLGEQVGGTLEVIAKDVKIQVEFNPATVEAFRLIGYENRILDHQDFHDDTKDAGEIGAGHSVTALYEIVPKGIPIELPKVDAKRYQPETERLGGSAFSGELMFVKLRHKAPDADSSKLIEMPLRATDVEFRAASENLRFAASVAGFAMLLRRSAYAGDLSFEKVRAFAAESRAFDPGNYRAEFLALAEKAAALPGLDPEILRQLRANGYLFGEKK
jgi:Ca-activated chloride channel family protein